MSLGDAILVLEDVLGMPFSYVVVLLVFIVFVGYTVLYSWRNEDRDKDVSQVVLSQMQRDNKALREDMAKTLKEVVGTIPQIIQSSMPRPQFPQPYSQPQFGQPPPQAQLPFGYPPQPQSQLQFITQPHPQFAPAPQPQPPPPQPQYPPSQTYGADIPTVLQDGSYSVGMTTNPDGSRIVRYIPPANNPQGYDYVDHTFPAPTPKPQETKPPQTEEKANDQRTAPKSKLAQLTNRIEKASAKKSVGDEPPQDGTQ